ncbi:hypothetical protein [Flavobacterium sp. KBS0721]|uniref:hypothetical protein n=1 Tax=Flavobacterium sp. KBS0721 TaxID=1179672 RepID=UPI00098F0F65|nr:hypothetical protein [Flavobacterium sp. KBS0721]QDW18877.1 hypothetical protein B0M43_0001755 [Flavobacterium sp. KBS0721]
MDKYLIKYLRDNSGNELSSKYIDFFKSELDWHIYNSERHIAENYHRNRKIYFKEKLIRFLQYSTAILKNSEKNQIKKINILSTVSFSDRNVLSNLEFTSFSPIWHPIGKKNIYGDLTTYNWHSKIQKLIKKDDFFNYLDLGLHLELENFQNHFLDQYSTKDFRALLLYTDQYFYSKYFIDVFKKLEKPSFVFTHGLPGIYTKDVDNRSDYLMVWSEKIKNNYIAAGFESSKIKVVGNPKFTTLEKQKELKSSLSDILVVPLSSALWHQHEYDKTVISDKSMVVLYLYKVQSVLKKMGVKRVRYRVHPSLNKKWVHAFLDQEFYIIDEEDLNTSLSRSSLVIGASSTVVLDSLIQGVNYLVFDPVDNNNCNMSGFELVPPFDGTEKKLMIAREEDDLENMLRNNVKTDYSLLHDYIQDFDPAILKELIK